MILLKFKRHAIEDIKKGNIKKAIFDDQCNQEWASLPGSPYDQGGVSLELVNEKFAKYLADEISGTSDLAIGIGGLNDLIK